MFSGPAPALEAQAPGNIIRGVMAPATGAELANHRLVEREIGIAGGTTLESYNRQRGEVTSEVTLKGEQQSLSVRFFCHEP